MDDSPSLILHVMIFLLSYTAHQEPSRTSLSPPLSRPNPESAIEITHTHTDQRRQPPFPLASLHSLALTIIGKFEFEIRQKRRDHFQYVRGGHGLSDTLAPAESEVHQQSRFGDRGRLIPARWVE